MSIRNILLAGLFVLLNSCSSREHLVFETVPMDGRLDSFAAELIKKGFTVSDSTKKNEIVLHGEFLNEECTIHVFGTEKKNVAYKLAVYFPEEAHDSLQSRFGRIQKQFNLKYGTGTSQYQKYKKRERLLYNVPGLALELRAGDFTKYTTDSGEITLEFGNGYLSITYLDRLNKEIRKAENEEQKADEISK